MRVWVWVGLTWDVWLAEFLCVWTADFKPEKSMLVDFDEHMIPARWDVAT